jgi:hypothetical protein
LNRFFIENSNTTLRKILNTEDNLDIVQNLIEAFLNLNIKEIYLRPYLGFIVKNLPKEEKYGVVNVKVIDEKNKEYNVGIQFMDGLYLQEKILTFGMSIHVNQTKYADFKDKADTLTINFLDYKGFKTDSYHKIITILEGDSYDYLKLKDEIKLHAIEIPNFIEKNIDTLEKEWLTYIKGEDVEVITKIKEKNPYIKKLDDLLIDYWKNETI